MSSLDVLLAQPLPRAVSAALMHFLWQGTIVAGVYALVVRASWGRAPAFRYLAGCMSLGAMAAMPIMTVWYLVGRASAVVEWRGLELAIGTIDAAASVSPPAQPASASSPLVTLQPWILGAWLVGVAALSIRLAALHLLVRGARREARPAPAQLATRFAAIQARMGSVARVTLGITNRFDTPTVVGWLRPVILMPVAVLASAPVAQLDHILLHELAHIRRHDVLVNLAQTIVESVFFFHPAVWWVSHRIRIDREHCCDARAVQVTDDPIGYARALTEIAALTLTAAPHPAVSTSFSSNTGESLMSRVEQVLGTPRQQSQRTTLPLAAALAGTLVAVGLVPLSAQSVAAAQQGNVAEQQIEIVERANSLRSRTSADVLKLLSDVQPLTRAAAARVLGEGSDLNAPAALTTALADAYPLVRKEATIALGQLSHSAAIPFLLKRLSDADHGVREQAAYAIAIIGTEHEPYVPEILRLVGDPAPNVRKGAARALGVMGSTSAIAPLRKLLEDADTGVRSAAAAALGQLSGGGEARNRDANPNFNSSGTGKNVNPNFNGRTRP